jgi:hypothetical protein
MDAGKPQKQSLAIAYNMKRKAKKMADGGEMDEYGFPKEDRPAPKPSQQASDDSSKKTVGQIIGYPMAEGGVMKSKRQRAMEAFYAEGGKVGGAETSTTGNYIGSYQSRGKPNIDGDLMPAAHLEQELAEHVAHMDAPQSSYEHNVMNQMGDEDEGAGDMDSIDPMVMRITMGRAKGYSKGGKVANEESGESTDEPTMAKADGNEFDDLALRDDLEFKDTGANSGDELDDAQENHDRNDIISRIVKSRAKRDRMPSPA